MTGEFEHLYRVALALAIGFVVGFERGWNTRTRESGQRTAGIRTFTLIGLLAGISAELSAPLGYAAPIVAFLGVLVLAVAGYTLEVRRGGNDIGLTTEIAMLLTFALGAYAVLGDPVVAAAAAVVTVAFLRLKPELHTLVAAIERMELNGAIRLLIISVVILPLLPDRGFGPGGVVNPFELWWMVVLISALSFLGYFAIKWAGPQKGPVVAGLLGGLASSTAVTLGFARMARRDPALVGPMSLGVGLACAIMFVRILIVAALIDPAVALQLAPPLGTMAATTFAVSAIVARRRPLADEPLAMDLGDPADIPAALKFGALLLGVAILSHVLQQSFGDGGIVALALASGLADVDAITLTMVRLSGAADPGSIAPVAITLAALSNTAVKAIIATIIGGPALARRVVPALGLAMLAGIAVVAVR